MGRRFQPGQKVAVDGKPGKYRGGKPEGAANIRFDGEHYDTSVYEHRIEPTEEGEDDDGTTG